MISYPASLLVLPFAALLGVVYVNSTRARSRSLRRVGRIGALSAAWVSPLATTGPGPAQLTVGLLVGFLGIDMVALGERWRHTALPPSFGRVLRAMVLPEDLMALVGRPVNIQGTRDWAMYVRGHLFDQPFLTLIDKSSTES